MSVKSHNNHPLTVQHDLAYNLARKVGLQALCYWNEQGVEGLGTEVKGLQDFVTKADKDAEHTIRSELADMFPEDGFIGEETGGEVDLSQNCAAPLTAYYTQKEKRDGITTYSRIQTGSGARSTGERVKSQAGCR